MAGEAAPVDVRLMAAASSGFEGVDISALARDLGVSRKTIYKWKARYGEEGLAGLEPRSRRPTRSPGRVAVGVEDRIVELRKHLAEEGLDAGPDTIGWHLAREGGACPSRSTIWRALVRRGFVTPEPKKRPKSSWRRFEAEFPNECWQIDATEWTLRGGRRVDIFNIVDDHSRLAVASVGVAAATTVAAWEVFSAGVSRFGMPIRCLSDNGLCFSGRLRGMEVTFEVNLRAAGVTPINSRPYHPQTCGKVERFQQTLKKWLRARPRPRSLRGLQRQLDEFCEYYNHQRPHRALGRHTPFERWSNQPRPVSSGEPIPGPRRRRQITISDQGTARAGHWSIAVGVEHQGRPATVVLDGNHANVFIDDQLVRHLELDRTRSYQPSGRRRGGPKRDRHLP